MSLIDQLKFDANGLIPAITRDVENGEVLMLAFMNAEAVEKTLKIGKVHYYSRSRRKLWMKGETSGHVQLVREIRFDCDADCLLISVEQQGAACHTGHHSCFYRSWEESGAQVRGEKTSDPLAAYARHDILNALYDVIQERRRNPSEKSYVASLFGKGLDKILGKIGEEATETAVAGKGGDPEQVVYEVADLLFHTLVLLGYYDLPPERVYDELRRRFGLSGIEEKASRSA
ncbi:phosphoribosyl-ATP pyrophosphatase /phosphoribosyl-AMP cyclohydrolase [Geoalkalibacter ferrihydriticus]|uniref:Histidine biosynthesis bifunctional protein HisIE n=2 Tax=Geoalkalibacter ferrihydriticus TaxID=392333 RepID=A0A0C2HG88_9BACT|nr:bifunctional phosphoribosyl-AMP cyclohydrolase/phosphoribosyl-ATP diphosphatase HisIE [Geoalkalibacter ferrihydriticus]KIH75951.1 phosphoribosyl-ATP diphosphatase [Geoalkalibacter ferrihydriticus DSM 17813]SDM56662.1 phosphoribosyl-ATP pyrophosphatase /phosphoribosyl-AMP cyclohydrolase [Geoalkalibacter ferrihydriticus]